LAAAGVVWFFHIYAQLNAGLLFQAVMRVKLSDRLFHHFFSFHVHSAVTQYRESTAKSVVANGKR
jgi:hypothetical protein